MKSKIIRLTLLFTFCINYLASQEKLIVKFNYSLLDFSFIDDKFQLTESLGAIFNDRATDLMRDFFTDNLSAENLLVEKIFPDLTTKDTVSISRLGHKITIPPFWACFRISVDNAELNNWLSIFNSYPKLIDYAHYDYKVESLNAPNDSLYNLQQSLYDPTGTVDINVEEAWNYETGKKFIKVAVIDNGIDSLHPDIDVLTGGGYWNDEQASLSDWGTEQGIPHGTPVAGIIGAKRNNEIGIAGIVGGDGNDTTGVSLIDIKYPFLTNSGVSYILAGVVDAARVVETYFDYGNDYYLEGDDPSHYYYNSAIGFGAHI